MAGAGGTYELGPESGELLVHTRRSGAAAKAGHDLELIVTRWSATLDLRDAPALTLTADGSSLRVREGRGGITPLDDGDKENIRRTIEDEVLRGCPIEFRSMKVRRDEEPMRVIGELELNRQTRPASLKLHMGRDRVTARATVRQTEWGMKPYTALFGTLRVADEVEITFEAELPRTTVA